MDENRGVFPEPRPLGHKVLRKLIARRGYNWDAQSQVLICRYENGQLLFQEPTAYNRFSHYIYADNYFVYVTALYYLYPPARPAYESTDRAVVATAWRSRPDNSRQWGYVVFTDYTRNVTTTWGFGGDLVGFLVGAHQLYPCMSIDTDLVTGARVHGVHLCVGLFYGRTNAGAANDARGRRRYIRGPIPDNTLPHPSNRAHYERAADQRLHSLGNVWEIIDRRFVAGIPQTPGVNRFFVLYVCAGARLVVIDDHNYDGNHNRSLVQQGGFVVVEYELEWAPPHLIVSPNGPFRAVTTAQAIQTGFLRSNPNVLAANLMAIDSPVVFLGATESQHETHCWGLNIDSLGGQRRAFLTAPEGGIVMAIENDTNGMAEIRGRHSYEQLYSSVVTTQHYASFHCCNPFAVPTQQVVLDKILGAGQHCDRWLAVDYNSPGIYQSNVAPVPARPQPIQYQPIRCTNHAVTQTRRFRPPMPPLSPLFHISPIDQFGEPAGELTYAFMPTKYDPDWCWRRRGPEWHRWLGMKVGNKYERFAPTNQYKALDHVQMVKQHYYHTWNIDGQTTYVGIDGWVYRQKRGAKYVGTFEYPVLERPE